MLHHFLPVLTAVAATVAVPQWWAVTPLEHVETAAEPPESPVHAFDIAAQPGEKEAYQIALQIPATTTFLSSGGSNGADVVLEGIHATGLPSTITLEVFKVVHVYCNQSDIYTLPGDRYIPDVLIPVAEWLGNATGTPPSSTTPTPTPAPTLTPTPLVLERGHTHAFWFRFNVAGNAPPGNSAGEITLSFNTFAIDVGYTLRVWDIAPVAPVGSAGSMQTIFSFQYNSTSLPMEGSQQPDMGKYYGHAHTFTQEEKRQYFQFLLDSRLNPDTPYMTAPRSIPDYQLLAEVGNNMNMMNLMDVQDAAGPIVGSNYTAEQINTVIELLAPTVAKLDTLGLLGNAYVYGFDEVPSRPQWVYAINQMFGAVKAKFPKLRTVAAIRWHGTEMEEISGSLDIWVQLYSLWNTTAATNWAAHSERHEAWAYHCISPRPTIDPTGKPGQMRWLNTFLESRPIEARMLSGWWGPAQGGGSAGSAAVPTGWLYYDINYWSGGRSSTNPKFASALETQSKPLRLLANSSLFTDFSARVYNGKANPEDHYAFSNGDGLLIYPGKTGAPYTSIRLENFRDGMEDFGLLKVLSDPAKAAALAAKVLKSDGTGVNITAGSPAAFELVRREAAAEAEAEATAAVNKHRPF